MKVCPRCRSQHPPEFYKHLYEDWYHAYTKRGLAADVAAKSALMQVQKHTPSAPTPQPFWLRIGARVAGGKEMSDAVKKGWATLDGKKTAIGAVLTFLVLVGPEIHNLCVQLGVTQEGLAYVTSGIMIIGAAHKIWKKFFNGVE